jgi:hypothetical protein
VDKNTRKYYFETGAIGAVTFLGGFSISINAFARLVY